MIIVKLMGGLGNQLFQIAFAKRLSLDYNEKIYIDNSWFEKNKIRRFSLNHFYIYDDLEEIDIKEIKKFNLYKLKINQKIYHIFQKAYRIINNTDIIGSNIYKFYMKRGLYYNFDKYYYDTIYVDKDIKNIYGYFQSEKYFKKYSKIINNSLKVKTLPNTKEKELLKDIKKHTSVAISIRLGDDYLKSKGLNIFNEQYILKSINYIKNILSYSNLKFYIFTDDVEKAKRINFNTEVHFIEGFSDYQSLRLMYNCDHFIITNSSFSWWGAYLGLNNNKIILSPNKWYSKSSKKPDIYYEKMKTLDI